VDANFGYSRFRQKGHYNTDSKKGITNKLHTIDKNKSSRNIALTSSRTHQAGRTSVMDEYMKVAMTKKKKNKYVHKVWFTYKTVLRINRILQLGVMLILVALRKRARRA